MRLPGSALIGDEEVRTILVGMAATIALAVLLALVHLRHNLGKPGGMRGYYTLYAVFGQVDGLRVGDAVMLSGIEVGTVAEMTLDPGFRARVKLAIEDGIVLPADTAAAIHTDGLFGNKFVVLDPGGDDAMLAPGGVISYTQDAVIVGNLLDLIIAEGRALRGGAGGKAR